MCVSYNAESEYNLTAHYSMHGQLAYRQHATPRPPKLLFYIFR